MIGSSLSRFVSRLFSRSTTGNRHKQAIESLEPRRLLTTTLAYVVSNNEMQSPDDPELWVGTIVMDGVSVTPTTLSGSGMFANFIDAPFSPASGSGFKWQFTGLPAHTMVFVDTNTINETTQSDSDVDELVIKVGSHTRTYSYSESGSTFSGSGGWVTDSSGSLTVEVYAQNLESGEDFVIEEMSLKVYNPTVSVTASAASQDEDDDTPIDFTVSRDLPTGYNATYHNAIPNTTVDVTRSGTATFTDDYTGTLPASTATLTGTTPTTFSVVPVWDAVNPEDDETISLNIDSGTGYEPHMTANIAEATIYAAPKKLVILKAADGANNAEAEMSVRNDLVDIYVKGHDPVSNSVIPLGSAVTATMSVSTLTPLPGGATLVISSQSVQTNGVLKITVDASGFAAGGTYRVIFDIADDTEHNYSQTSILIHLP